VGQAENSQWREWPLLSPLACQKYFQSRLVSTFADAIAAHLSLLRRLPFLVVEFFSTTPRTPRERK